MPKLSFTRQFPLPYVGYHRECSHSWKVSGLRCQLPNNPMLVCQWRRLRLQLCTSLSSPLSPFLAPSWWNRLCRKPESSRTPILITVLPIQLSAAREHQRGDVGTIWWLFSRRSARLRRGSWWIISRNVLRGLCRVGAEIWEMDSFSFSLHFPFSWITNYGYDLNALKMPNWVQSTFITLKHNQFLDNFFLLVRALLSDSGSNITVTSK